MLRGGVAVVELERIRPSGQIGVPAVRQEHLAALALDPDVVLRGARQLELRAGEVVLGVVLDPGMIEGGVVGDEVEHQAQSARPQTLAKAGERCVSAQVGMHRVTGDGKPGTRDVLLSQVRQRLLEFAPPVALGARHPLSGRSRVPHAQEPDPVESHRRHAVQLGVGDVVQGGRAAPGPGQLVQPDAGVDLVERWIARQGAHLSAPGAELRGVRVSSPRRELWGVHVSAPPEGELRARSAGLAAARLP